MINVLAATKAIKEAQDALRCHCHTDYTKRGMHGPDCLDYLVEPLQDAVDLILGQAVLQDLDEVLDYIKAKNKLSESTK